MSGVLTAADEASLQANVRRFYVYRFLNNLNLWLPIWVLYLQQERGLSLAAVTALDAPFWLINVLAQVPTGAFADRFGRKKSLLVGCVVLGCGYLLFGLASSFPVLLFSYALWSAGMAFGSGADLALLYDNLAALGRTDDYQKAAGRAFGLTSAAAIVALIVGAELAKRTRLDVPIIVSGIITLATTFVVLGFHEPPHAGGPRPHPVRAMQNAMVIAWRRPALRYLLAFSAALLAVSMTPVIFVQPFLAHYNTPVAAYGLLQTPARVCGIIAALFAYRLVRRAGDRATLGGLTAWLCFGLALIAVWPSPLAFVAFPLMALGFNAANPLVSDALNKLIPTAERATILSFGQLLSSLLMIGFEPALGSAAQRYGLAVAFALSALFLAAAGLLALVPWMRAAAGDAGAQLTNEAVRLNR